GLSRQWTTGLLQALLVLLLALNSGRDLDPCKYAVDGRNSRPLRSRMPTGKLLFNDNQASFMMEGERGFDLSSVLLFSLDDIGACDNQFEYHAGQRMTSTDLL